MPEAPSGFDQIGGATTEMSWKLGPRDFVFKNLKYLPWLGISCLIALAIAFVKIRYEKRIYHVQSSMLIQNDRGNANKDNRFDEMFMTQGSTNLSNEIQILTSRPIMQRVARDLGFQTRYYGTGKVVKSSLSYPGSPVQLEVLHIADSSMGVGFNVNIIDDLRFSVDKSTKTFAFGEPISIGENRFVVHRNNGYDVHMYSTPVIQVRWDPVSSAAESLIGGLKIIQASDQATILTLTYETENIALGQDLLNMLMHVYDSLVIEDKNRISLNTLNFIDRQLAKLNTELGNVEGGIKAYKVDNDVFDLEGQSKLYLENLEESSKMLSQQEVRISILDWLLKYVNDTQNVDKTVPTHLGIEEPALGQLITEYNQLQLELDANLKTTTPNNPLIQGMRSTLEKIRGNIAQALQNVKQAYVIARDKMLQQGTSAQGQLKSLPGKSLQLMSVQRRQKILEDLYSFLLQKKLETSISYASTISNSKVVEPATGSPRPVSPNKTKIYTLYLILGLILPVGIISLRELMRDKVDSRVDVEKRHPCADTGRDWTFG